MDTIVGGTISNDGVVKLTVDSDKVAYIILPNKSVLETVAGVIDDTNTGIAGKIMYYVPKNSTNVIIANSEIEGDIIYNGSSNLTAENCVLLTSLNASLVDGTISTGGSAIISDLIASKAVSVQAQGCSLTAASIGAILIAAYNDDRLLIDFDFSGGNNAISDDVDAYVTTEYGVSLPTITTLLVTTNGGTITLDAV